LVGGVFLLVGASVLAVKLLNVVAGAAIVLVVGCLMDALGLSRHRTIAVWATAVWPLLLFWSAAMMKETFSALLLLAALLAVLELPRTGAAIALTACLTLLALTRMPGFIAGGLVFGVLWGLRLLQRRPGALQASALGLGAVGIALLVLFYGVSSGRPT